MTLADRKGEQKFIVVPTDRDPIIIDVDREQLPPVEGCPAINGNGACWSFCGGGWPGTRMKTAELTMATYTGQIKPENLGCQPIQDRAAEGLARAKTIFEF